MFEALASIAQDSTTDDQSFNQRQPGSPEKVASPVDRSTQGLAERTEVPETQAIGLLCCEQPLELLVHPERRERPLLSIGQLHGTHMCQQRYAARGKC